MTKRYITPISVFTIAALLIVLLPPVKADHGSGCPIVILASMKVFEDENGQVIPHDGQWFTANYPGGVCGTSEVDVVWSISPSEGVVTDTCFNALDFVVTLQGGAKKCNRTAGKVFWVKHPGVYDVTATSPAGGIWTLEGVVVD
jgi:hypothetical protein